MATARATKFSTIRNNSALQCSGRARLLLLLLLPAAPAAPSVLVSAHGAESPPFLNRSAAWDRGDAVPELPDGCTFQPLQEADPSNPGGDSSCYSDHWCHGSHNWCKAHMGSRTLPYGAPGCSDVAAGGNGGSLCDPTKVSPTYCARVCWAWKGYRISAATGYDKDDQCYCGDKPDKSGVVQPSSSCARPCPGVPSKTCGGDWLVNLGAVVPAGCGGLGPLDETEVRVLDYAWAGLILYFVGSVVVNRLFLGKYGWETLPHAIFLREVAGLVQDGIQFTARAAKGGGQRSGGDRAEAVRRASNFSVSTKFASFLEDSVAVAGEPEKLKTHHKKARARDKAKKVKKKHEHAGGTALQESLSMHRGIIEERVETATHPSQARVTVIAKGTI